MKTKVSDASANTYMNFPSSGNVSVEASQESIEIDKHINTDISENVDDSFHLSQNESETDDEEIRSSQCNNRKRNMSLSSLKLILVFCQEC